MSGAVKHDGGKLRWSLLPTEGLEPIIRVLMHGVEKYDAHNWRLGMDWTRAYDAAQRHLQAWLSGVDVDPESGGAELLNLAQAAVNILFLLTYAAEGEGRDDRYRSCEAVPYE